MDRGATLQVIADIVLLTHVVFVAFVVFGLLFIVWGGLRKWGWIRNPWFRAAHLVAIGVVVLQSWFGMVCPLTTWEMSLRESAGADTYEGAFIAHWLQTLLYYDAPEWVFAVVYTLFGLVVAGTWFGFRPRPFRKTKPRFGKSS